MHKQDIIDNVTLLASLIQATMWQYETIAHEFGGHAKYKIKLFGQHGYNMVDSINKNIQGQESAEQYFDETTSDAIDIFKEYIKCQNKQELFEIIKKYNKNELNIIRD
jgi:hypothetical protein